MTWVKICGITNLEDAMVAVEAGADALGFVFYEKSPRKIDSSKAKDISIKLAGIEKIGLFVNQDENAIVQTAEDVGLTGIQMHGDNEDPHVADLVAQRTSLKVLPAISMNGPKPQSWAMMWSPDSVRAFLLDSGNASTLGGTGKTFDWRASLEGIDVIKRLGKVVLAGGLNPENVAEAMGITKPWGVDVSSGVEARPGKKDPEKVRAFIKAVRDSDKASSN